MGLPDPRAPPWGAARATCYRFVSTVAGHVRVLASDRQVADQLLLGGNAHRAGTRRLSVHVHDVGSCAGKTKNQAVVDGPAEADLATAVRERVWCDVQDAYDKDLSSTGKPWT